MRKSVSALLGLSVVVVLVVTGCSDTATTAPSLQRSTTAPSNLLGINLGGTLNTLTSLLVAPVTRNTPLDSDVSWTFTAGPGGATSSNSAVGLTIVVPYGALSSTQTITVTALAGAPVAYRFEPHLVFNKKVVLTQSLTGTSVGLLGLVVLNGAHFTGDVLDVNADGLVAVDETVPALLTLLTNRATFSVGHFSGWIVASGVGDDSGGAW